jgi:hypothetical protein
MRSLGTKGLVKKRLVTTERFRNWYWSLTPSGYEKALEIARSVRSKIEELDVYQQLSLLERFGVYQRTQDRRATDFS